MPKIKTGQWIEDADALAAFVAKKSTGTYLNSQMIAEQWDDAAKSKAFFSARVTDADILEGMRRQIARVVSGEITEEQARFWIRDFLKSKGDSALQAMGFLPQEDAKDAGLSELASTSRINLIIEQNTRMAHAARKYQEMQEERHAFPYVQYHTREDSKVRNSHRLLDGKVFRVDDPALRRIMPPQDFRCRCWLTRLAPDELDGREVEDGLPGGWEPPSSGYTFDPAKWAEQGQEAREQWGDDLKQGFMEETAKHAESEAAFLLKRREFWQRELTGEDPATAAEAIRNIDGRIDAIREQQTRPMAKAREDMIAEVEKEMLKQKTPTPQSNPMEDAVKAAESMAEKKNAAALAKLEETLKARQEAMDKARSEWNNNPDKYQEYLSERSKAREIDSKIIKLRDSLPDKTGKAAEQAIVDNMPSSVADMRRLGDIESETEALYKKRNIIARKRIKHTLSGEEYAASRAEEDAVMEAISRNEADAANIRTAIDKLKPTLNAAILKSVSGTSPAKISAPIKAQVLKTPEIEAKIKEGLDKASGLLGNRSRIDGKTMEIGDSTPRHKDGRPYHFKGNIYLSVNRHGPDEVSHETAHAAEFHDAELQKRGYDYLMKRAAKAGNKTAYLASRFPESGYDPKEEYFTGVFKDDMYGCYAARIYGQNDIRNEIFSIGVELLLKDAAGFAMWDFDYFIFTIRQLLHARR